MISSMQNSDAFAWYMEKDPTLRATIVGVAWLESGPDWPTLVANVDRATRAIPMFRQCVVERPGMLANPRWVADDRFDLTYHLRRIDSPAPHTSAAVMKFARDEYMTAFDHAHPLWAFTLIEGLERGRAALVMKVHHALTDGIGGVQLALELFDVEAAPPARAAAPDPPREHRASDWERARGFVSRTARSVVPAMSRATRHPATGATEVFKTVRSIARTLAPVSETLSPIMKDRSVARELDLVEVQVSDLKRAAATAGGSLNDGFLAAATGGLRRYHEAHDDAVDELRVTMPISIRTPDDPPGGNRITLIRFAVPVSDPDPSSRIRAMGRLCHAAREERSLRYTGAIAGTLNLLPRGVVGGMLKHVDFVASDIPGFASPLYLAGAPVTKYIAFAPTTGSAVNLALLSYNGTCCIGISVDAAAVPDPAFLAQCFREGFDEVLALGGAHDAARLPLRDDAEARLTTSKSR